MNLSFAEDVNLVFALSKFINVLSIYFKSKLCFSAFLINACLDASCTVNPSKSDFKTTNALASTLKAGWLFIFDAIKELKILLISDFDVLVTTLGRYSSSFIW
ncbi:Uncharacterised protein, partial [Mycoplasma putrefaciens]